MGHFVSAINSASILLRSVAATKFRLLNTFIGYFTATNQTRRDSYNLGYKWADFIF